MDISEADRAELRRQSEALNKWMVKAFFQPVKAVPKRSRKRTKPCPKCGAEISASKPMCFKCFTNRDENGNIR